MGGSDRIFYDLDGADMIFANSDDFGLEFL